MRNELIALYGGTFDPFHIGHLNILEKAEAIFGKDNVIVCVGINPSKIPQSILNVISNYGERSKNRVIENIKDTAVNRIKYQIPSKNIEGFIGFLTDYVHKINQQQRIRQIC